MKKHLLFAAFLLALSPLRAQWIPDTDLNTLVAASATGDIQSIGTADGRTYVAFWHDVPPPVYYEMRLQLLDNQGIPKFGDEGMVVNNTVPMSSYTTLWSMNVDRDNNVYIAFNGTGTGNPVFVHKIAPDGTQLWGAAGVSPGAGFDPKVVPLTTGEAVVTWLPGNKAMMQKISANGTPVWPSPLTVEPSISTHKASAGELIPLSDGGYEIIIHDRTGFSPSGFPYVQRYNNDGGTVWPSPVAISTTFGTAYNRRYSVVQDGDVVYFGYAGYQGLTPHGFIERINPDGTLPWGVNGKDFSVQSTLYERDVLIGYEDGTDHIWAVCEYTDNAQNATGEYVQKLDKATGERLLTENAREVFPVSLDRITHRGSLQVVADKPLFLVSLGDANGVTPLDLQVAYLDEAGDFFWPTEHTKKFATNPTGVKSRIQFNRPFNGKAVGVWTENRPAVGQSRPYAQSIELACQTATPGFTYSANMLDVAFTSAASGADEVYWSFGDGAVNVGPSVQHLYPAPGVYGVCQYVVNQCGIDSLCQEINVTCQLPQAGFEGVIQNHTATFTATASLNDDVYWDFGDGLVGVGLVASHTYSNPGTYNVCELVVNDCGSDTLCASITIIASGVKNPEASFSVSLSPNPSHGQWVMDVNLPESAIFNWKICAASGQLVQGNEPTVASGRQQIQVDTKLPAGTYFLIVTVNGTSKAIPVVVD